VDDPLIGEAGITLDRTPSGAIAAPTGMVRVCAYHVDFDERPTCWQDVATLEEARHVCDTFAEAAAGWNVDFAIGYDALGCEVTRSGP
jgi:hypothetical protein